MQHTCPPCSGDCNQGRTCTASLDSHEYAENSYAHLGGGTFYLPREQARVEYRDEPLSDCAKACWAVALCIAGAIVAAGLFDWLMSLN